MNRNEMIEGIMRQAGISKANVDRFYEGLVALAGRELLKNNRFVLPGLGVLRVRRRAARMARNPQTGETITIRCAACHVLSIAISSQPSFWPG